MPLKLSLSFNMPHNGNIHKILAVLAALNSEDNIGIPLTPNLDLGYLHCFDKFKNEHSAYRTTVKMECMAIDLIVLVQVKEINRVSDFLYFIAYFNIFSA
jgi:hypothetical protein